MRVQKKIIKVCGLKDPDNMRAVGMLRPDMMGFIFHRPSPRDVTDTIGDLPLLDIPASVTRVAVVVDQSLEFCLGIVERFGFGAIQLHGYQTPEFCRTLRKHCLVIKAFALRNALPVDVADYEGCCDYFLFDTAGTAAGGSGMTFNHAVLYNYRGHTPFLVAGGLDHDTSLNILDLPIPYMAGVDLNSRYEITPGIKDPDRVNRTITSIRQPRPHKQGNPLKNLRLQRVNQLPHPDENGYYGEFGGAFIPELLQANVDELKSVYKQYINEEGFKNAFGQLLNDYVGRPTPLYYALRLSELFGCRIYLKREDLCHTGAHKLNNVVGQALLAQKMNKKQIVAETGAGQHGVATATVCAMLGLPCRVFMGEKDTRRQKVNVLRMKMLGAEVIPVTSGSQTLKDATNEAIRYWINHPDDTYYLIGSSIGPHPYPDMVARFQSVISHEIKWQLAEKEGRQDPDYVLACVGGGSNAAGAFFHFIDNGFTRLVGAEAAGKGVNSGHTAATISVGSQGVLHGTKTLLMQNADGQIVEAHSISAGLDYPGIGPMHAWLHHTSRAGFLAITDTEAMEAARMLSLTEGIIPAIESAHALALLNKLSLKETDVVVVNLSGRGDKDMETYSEYYPHYEENKQKQ